MDNIQNLIDKSGQTDITALLSAKENAKRRMVEEPTATNVAAFDRACTMLDKALASREAATSAEGPKRFDRVIDVIKYLKDQGYKIGKSKLYADVKSGFLTGSESDGYSIEAVLAYAHTQMLDKATDKGEKIDILTEKRLQKEVEKLTAQVEKLTFELAKDHGKYLLKEEVKTELALRVAAFEAALKHVVRINCIDWVTAVSGDISRVDDLVTLLWGHFDEMLNEMAEVEELGLVVKKASC